MNRFKKYFENMKSLLEQIGYAKAVILFVAGMVLIVLSFPEHSKNATVEGESKQGKESVKTEYEKEEDWYVKQLENRFQDALQGVEGVGKAQVMITLDTSSETVLNKDEECSNSQLQSDNQIEQSEEKREETVMSEGENGVTSPYVVKRIQPKIAGIVVVCEGGDQQYVINEITSAAEVLFSVSAHKVKVMKKLNT